MFGDSFFHEQKIYDLKSSVKVVDKCGQISIEMKLNAHEGWDCLSLAFW